MLQPDATTRLEDPEVFWALPERTISDALVILHARQGGAPTLAALLVYGAWRKHPLALDWIEKGGRKVGGVAMRDYLAEPPAREHYHRVLRVVIDGEPEGSVIISGRSGTTLNKGPAGGEPAD